MHIYDLTRLGFSNLLKNKVRTLLTVLGVVVGIASLVSMVSFGVGLQKTITDSFVKNDLFTSLKILSSSANPSEEFNNRKKDNNRNKKVLDDKLLSVILKMKEVEIAFPEVSFTAQIQADTLFTMKTVEAIPGRVSKYPPYNNLLTGRFFSSDSAYEIVLYENIFEELGYQISGNDTQSIKKNDSNDLKLIKVKPEELIGKEIYINTATFRQPTMFDLITGKSPVGKKETKFKLVGILKKSDQFSMNFMPSGALIPIATASKIPRPDFTNIYDFIDQTKQKKGYPSIYVRVKKIKDLDPVNAAIKKMGYNTFVMSDSLKEIKRNFLIVDAILGIMGIIALFVASLGIINTMLMSIMERTKEIGIMKSVGGGEGEIMSIFSIEASMIGLIGGILGNIIGYGVTKVAYWVMLTKFSAQNAPEHIFYFPAWLILGSLAFAVLVSLLAGLYPALKAARIDPVKALRHD